MFFCESSQMDLRSVWLCGFLLISFSLYATRLLPSLRDQTKHVQNGETDPTAARQPSVTIFSAPRPFSGVLGERQVLAVRSWLSLSPEVEVVLFVKHPTMVSPIQNLSRRVSIETAIDFTFLGTPFFHAMVARSRASSSDISVMVDSETILLPTFFSALSYASKIEHNWLLVATPHHISRLPFHLADLDWQRVGETGKRIQIKKLEEFAVQTRQHNNDSGRWLWAWNTGELPLHGCPSTFLVWQRIS